MNKSDLEQLAAHYQLTKIIKLTPLVGSRVNQTWRLDTATDSFFVKRLNQDINNLYSHQLTGELIAKQFANKLALVNAVQVNQQPIALINQQAYLLYPWCEATTKSNNQLSTNNRMQIAKLLAQIHSIDLQLDQAPSPETLSFDWLNWDEQLQQLKTNKAYEQLVTINKLITPYRQQLTTAEELLNSNLAISHRDLDPNNVLWDKQNRPTLIDWEYAGRINRSADFFTTAICWSLDRDYQFNKVHYQTFQNSYLAELSQPIDRTASWLGLLTSWLNWLNFNIAKVLKHSPHSDCYQLSLNEIQHTTTALTSLLAQSHKLLTA